MNGSMLVAHLIIVFTNFLFAHSNNGDYKGVNGVCTKSGCEVDNRDYQGVNRVCTKSGCTLNSCWKYCASLTEVGSGISFDGTRKKCDTGKYVDSQLVPMSCKNINECDPCWPCVTTCY